MLKPELFKRMFKNHIVSNNMTCGASKMSYVTTFGLSPHFSSLLDDRLAKSDSFTLLFDESLNEELTKKQMDIHCRFWNGEKVN